MAAFAIFFIALSIILFGTVYVCSNVALNQLIVEMNSWITAGKLSEQFSTYWNFSFGLWMILPILFLIALSAAIYVHSIQRSDFVETPLTSYSFLGGVVAVFFGMFITIALFYAVALPAEQFVSTMETGGYYDVAEEWASYDSIVFWMNIVYIVVVLPLLTGVISMFLGAIRVQQYDVVSDEVAPAPNYISSAELEYGGR